MAHVKQQVRTAALALLQAALPLDSIVAGRVRPVDRDRTVSIGLYTPGEQVAEDGSGGEQTRLIRLRIDIATKGDEAEALDRLDGRQTSIEQAFANDPDLGGLAAAVEFRGSDMAPMLIEGERPFSVMSMLFDVTLYTVKTDPETTN